MVTAFSRRPPRQPHMWTGRLIFVSIDAGQAYRLNEFMQPSRRRWATLTNVGARPLAGCSQLSEQLIAADTYPIGGAIGRGLLASEADSAAGGGRLKGWVSQWGRRSPMLDVGVERGGRRFVGGIEGFDDQLRWYKR